MNSIGICSEYFENLDRISICFMKRMLLWLLLCFCPLPLSAAEAPLRVFIRAGVKTHGPNQHDHPRFLKEWKQLLAERGMKADGAMTFPTADQLENTDVLIVFA